MEKIQNTLVRFLVLGGHSNCYHRAKSANLGLRMSKTNGDCSSIPEVDIILILVETVGVRKLCDQPTLVYIIKSLELTGVCTNHD